MRTVILIIGILISSFTGFTQSNRDFDQFLKLFPGQIIDSVSQVSILQKDYFPQFETVFAERVLSESETYTAVIIRIECNAGGLCGSKSVYTFTKNGHIISSSIISKSKADCSFENSIKPIILTPNLITIKIRNSTFDCDNDKMTYEEIFVKSLQINDSGKIIPSANQRIDLRREFHIVSHELISEKELESLDHEKLAIMRNEIFASYGYQFKTEKWNNYFSSFKWYKPTRNSVNESELNEIEKRNLALIKKLEAK
jgi:YARHG domain-containing protein